MNILPIELYTDTQSQHSMHLIPVGRPASRESDVETRLSDLSAELGAIITSDLSKRLATLMESHAIIVKNLDVVAEVLTNTPVDPAAGFQIMSSLRICISLETEDELPRHHKILLLRCAIKESVLLSSSCGQKSGLPQFLVDGIPVPLESLRTFRAGQSASLSES